jgi:hypothetical protein
VGEDLGRGREGEGKEKGRSREGAGKEGREENKILGRAKEVAEGRREEGEDFSTGREKKYRLWSNRGRAEIFVGPKFRLRSPRSGHKTPPHDSIPPEASICP